MTPPKRRWRCVNKISTNDEDLDGSRGKGNTASIAVYFAFTYGCSWPSSKPLLIKQVFFYFFGVIQPFLSLNRSKTALFTPAKTISAWIIAEVHPERRRISFFLETDSLQKISLFATSRSLIRLSTPLSILGVLLEETLFYPRKLVDRGRLVNSHMQKDYHEDL